MRKPWTRVLPVVGSLGMAVFLLLAIASVLAWGTFYEARFGTPAAQRFVYHSWWFQGLLAFLGLNLAAAAVQRIPWQRKHIPFVLAHVGIILILIGGILGGRRGIEGQLILSEGQTGQFLRLSQSVLVVHPMNPGEVFEFPTRFESRAWVREPDEVFQVPVKDRTLTLTVDRYLPDARAAEEVLPDGLRENPAVHLILAEGQQELWLFARDPQRFIAASSISGKEAYLLFLEFRTKEPLRQMKLPRWAVCLLKEPSLDPVLVMTGAPGQQKREPFEVGKRYRHPWLGLEFRADRFYPKARVERGYSPQGQEIRQEALHLTADDGRRKTQAWLTGSDSVTLSLGDEEVLLEYRKAAWKLPVTLKLLDFRKTVYPGTEVPSGFESDVELTDPQRGLTIKRTINMNNPLKYRGFSFFQSGYLEGPTETTILSVRKDPGTPLVYLGCLIVVAGVISMFIFRRGDNR